MPNHSTNCVFLKLQPSRTDLSDAVRRGDLLTLPLPDVSLDVLTMLLICPLQSGPKVNLDWTLKETEHGQEARA